MVGPIFSSSNTGVLEKANCFGGCFTRWRKDPHSTWTEMALFGHFSRGDPFLCMSIHNKPGGFNDTSESTRQVIRRK